MTGANEHESMRRARLIEDGILEAMGSISADINRLDALVAEELKAMKSGGSNSATVINGGGRSDRLAFTVAVLAGFVIVACMVLTSIVWTSASAREKIAEAQRDKADAIRDAVMLRITEIQRDIDELKAKANEHGVFLATLPGRVQVLESKLQELSK